MTSWGTVVFFECFCKIKRTQNSGNSGHKKALQN